MINQFEEAYVIRVKTNYLVRVNKKTFSMSPYLCKAKLYGHNILAEEDLEQLELAGNTGEIKVVKYEN